MSNQLTPMQEAIEKVTELHNNEEITGFTKRAYSICLDVLSELLPKEQQVIEDSFNDCIKAKYTNALIDMKFKVGEKQYETGKDYYNTKFKQNDK